jgi:Family of unknown function (DUF5317)
MKLPKIPYAWIPVAPFMLFAAGFALNALVLTVNGNQMPVFTSDNVCSLFFMVHDFLHTCMTPNTHLNFLADWIVLDHGAHIASPGDLLLWASDWLRGPAVGAWFALVIKDYNNLPK